MPTAPTLGEPSIPLPQPPLPAEGASAPEAAEQRLLAAVRRLIWLAAYVTLMRLFGYRLSRPAATTPARPAAAHAPAPIPQNPQSPEKPRKKHKYIDREMCIGLLAGIERDVAPAPPPPAPARPHPTQIARAPRPAPPDRPPPRTRARPRPSIPHPIIARPITPPRSKTRRAAHVEARPFRCGVVTNWARPSTTPPALG